MEPASPQCATIMIVDDLSENIDILGGILSDA